MALITNTFDVVLALEVIYYLRTLEDQKQALLQLYGLVKNNGYALFSVNLGEGYFNEHDFLKMVTEPGFVICDTRYLRNTWYILYERKMCWFYDAAKELKNKSFFLCPIFYCLELIVRCFLSSKIIARIGFFLSIFSKKAPSVLCILLKKEINE